jgi:hypothetical protein
VPAPGNKIVQHLVGVMAFVLIGVGVAMLYMLVVGKLLGRGGDGFGLAASIFTFPLLACTSAVFCWLPLWLLHYHRLGAMSPGRALLLGAVIGAVVAFVIAGPGGFLLQGGAPLFNYFLILMLAAGALVHNWVASGKAA